MGLPLAPLRVVLERHTPGKEREEEVRAEDHWGLGLRGNSSIHDSTSHEEQTKAHSIPSAGSKDRKGTVGVLGERTELLLQKQGSEKDSKREAETKKNFSLTEGNEGRVPETRQSWESCDPAEIVHPLEEGVTT